MSTSAAVASACFREAGSRPDRAQCNDPQLTVRIAEVRCEPGNVSFSSESCTHLLNQNIGFGLEHLSVMFCVMVQVLDLVRHHPMGCIALLGW
jgi:hypothetical protein